MRAELIRDERVLAALEPAWWALFGRCAAATPFSSPAWLLPWWKVFAPGELFTVAVTTGGRLVGLAPLYLERGLESRRLLPLGIGITDYADVLLDPLHAGAAWAAILDCLQAEADTWDVWCAEELPPEAAVLAQSLPQGWTSRTEAQSACPVLALRSPFSASDLPSTKRRKWRMAQNRTARRASDLRTSTAATLDADLTQLFRLHAARWADRGEAGVLADDVVQRFHAAAAPALLAAGLLRLTTLTLDGMMVAAYYGLHHGSRAFAYLGGFDPQFAFESPGTVLMGTALETAAREGATEFHFLRGRESYKYDWGAVDRWNSRRDFTVRR